MPLREELSELLKADQKELLQVQEKLDALHDKVIDLQKSIESTEYLLAHKFGVKETIAETSVNIPIKSSKRRSKKNSITNLTFGILFENGNEPLHIGKINKLINERGKVFSSKSAPTSLNRDERFENIGDNTYRIKNEFYQKESASSGE